MACGGALRQIQWHNVATKAVDFTGQISAPEKIEV